MTDSKNNLEIVYVCKSCYYPEFRRRILSLLSLPNGARFETDYDEKWVSEDVKTNPNHFRGKRLYAIFLDFSTSTLNFYPLRECRVLDIVRAGGLFKLTLELGNYKIPSNKEGFSKTVKNCMTQKRILDEDERKLVFGGDDTIAKELSEKTKQEDTWKQIVEYLASLDDIEVPPQVRERNKFNLNSLFSIRFELWTENASRHCKRNVKALNLNLIENI